MRGNAGKVLGIAVTLVCLALAIYGVNFSELQIALAGANYVLIAPALLMWLIGYVARTLRWRAILAGSPVGSLTSLFGVLMVGFATNNLLPARLGEFARAYLLRRRTGLRKTFVLASIFLERIFDGLALVAVIMVVSALVELPNSARNLEYIAGVLFIGVGLGVIVVLYRYEFVAKVVALVTRPLPARIGAFANGAFTSFVHGLSSMRRPKVVASTSFLSVVVWGIEWAAYMFVVSAFNLGLSPWQQAAACAFLLVVVNLGIMLPAAPGYVGTFQFFAVSALAVWEVPREEALAVAIVAHLTQYVLVTGIGLLFFGREHVSLRTVANVSRDDGDSDLGSGTPGIVVSEARP